MIRIALLSLTLISLAVPASAVQPSRTPESLRRELDELFVLQDYTPGKTSFVLGLETLSGRPRLLEKGDRYTVLDIEGIGSLRHIWETHGDIDPAPFRFEFFVDGESKPSIHGSLPDLIDAAMRCEQNLIANPGSHVANSSHNWYLPVPFEESLRVDVVLTGEPTLLFMQLDYRTDDDSLRGYRLHQTAEDGRITLHMDTPNKPSSELKRRPELDTHTKQIGTGAPFTIPGPAIIRRLAVPDFERGDRMRIWFDKADTPAVDVDLADFYGLYESTAFDKRACYVPMPFHREARIEIDGEGSERAWRVEADTESIPACREGWGYFHANHHQEISTYGYRPFQNLYVRGKGHFVGLSLYDSHHDHGGGDFAVIDGETDKPAFIHGINGEDYFSFAYFGKGKNPPYSEAFTNEQGRYRLHLENPYPFRKSLQLSFGTVKDISPRSVALWYQAEPEDTTLVGNDIPGLTWQVFGPVDVPVIDDGNTPDLSDPEKLFANLPTPAQLDAGETHKVTRFIFEALEGEQTGWAKQRAVGPHLNLMYIERHTTIKGDPHMSYVPRALMARTSLVSDREQKVTLQLSWDDPLIVTFNDDVILRNTRLRRGFTTENIKVTLKKGENELLARMLDTPNVNTCWAALNLRVLDETGRDISQALQP